MLAWPYLFKHYSTPTWRKCSKSTVCRSGSKYPPGTPDEEKVTLRAVTGLGHAAAGIIPEYVHRFPGSVERLGRAVHGHDALVR
ncbi:hypothetical protein [Pseudomonas aeruginosa]|uniref:hypothetical protein n=1 Tax=Pseudomonas aeruginosa TaxID=287 RepID=UPI003D6ACF7E